MKTVSCLGVLVVDALSSPLRSYPVPGKINQVLTDKLQFSPGGGAANTGSALAQLGVQVTVFSKVGDDLNGAFILKTLQEQGVDTSGICVSADDTTPFTYVGIDENGDRTFLHTPGANKTFRLDDLDRERLLDGDFLLYQDLWVLPGIDGDPGAELLAEARDKGIVTLVDECWGLGPNRDTWEAVVPYADYVLPSLDDMKTIYPDLDRDAIAEHLLGLGCKYIILKMSAEGCLVYSDGQREIVPTSATEIVDTTGAGDCFDAGFIAGLVNGLSAVDSAVVGAKAAAACIRHVGGAVGIPRFEELKYN